MKIIPDCKEFDKPSPCQNCFYYSGASKDICKKHKDGCEYWRNWWDDYVALLRPVPIEITDAEWEKIFSGFICEAYCFNCNSSASIHIHKARDNFAQYLKELLELKK
jgi:hypothetical protein